MVVDVGALLAVAVGGLGRWGAPVVGAVVLGALAFGARVLAAVPRESTSGIPPVAPRSLDQPWRGAVEQVQDARRRFDEAVSTLAEGPLRERLDGVADRLDVALQEAWRVGRAGHLLSKGRKRIDTTRINAELNHARAQPPTPRQADTIAAMESQLASAARIETTIAEAYDRLQLLDARTDEAVARAALDAGINFICTCADYQDGQAEASIGEAIGHYHIGNARWRQSPCPVSAGGYRGRPAAPAGTRW